MKGRGRAKTTTVGGWIKGELKREKKSPGRKEETSVRLGPFLTYFFDFGGRKAEAGMSKHSRDPCLLPL